MEKWDVHTHTTVSPETYDALGRFIYYADFVRVRKHETMPCCAVMVNSKDEVQRLIEDNAYDAKSRLRDCDRHGVTMQVISPTPMMIPDYVDNQGDAEDICRILNDDNAALVAKHPDRFTALGAVPMMFPDRAIAEMERLKKIGMRGIEINSNVKGLDLDDELFFPVFQAAEQMGMAVFIHPWGGFMKPEEEALRARMNTARNWRPWLIGMGMETALAFDSMRSGRVHERLPRLRVLYAHGGGAFPALLGRLEHGAYCRPDLFKDASQMNPLDTVKGCGIYADTLVHSQVMLRALIDLLGVDRVAMGSDYPYPLGEVEPYDEKTMQNFYSYPSPYPKLKGLYPGYGVEHLELSDRDRQRLLSGTAKEWLGIS